MPVFTSVKIKQGERELSVMVGRKRKQGKRYKCGQRVQERQPSPAEVAASMPHRRRLPADRRHDHKAECPIGALNLIGVISDIQYDAAEKFRLTVARYRQVIESPREPPNILASQYVAPRSEENAPIPIRLKKPMTDKEATERRDEYNGAIEAIFGHRPRVVINSVVIYEKQLQAGDLPYLRVALDSLCTYYGLTRAGKSALRK